MKIDKLKDSISGFLKSRVGSFSCHGRTYEITGLALTVAVLLVIMHVCIIKCISCRLGRLKERCRRAEGDE